MYTKDGGVSILKEAIKNKCLKEFEEGIKKSSEDGGRVMANETIKNTKEYLMDLLCNESTFTTELILALGDFRAEGVNHIGRENYDDLLELIKNFNREYKEIVGSLMLTKNYTEKNVKDHLMNLLFSAKAFVSKLYLTLGDIRVEELDPIGLKKYEEVFTLVHIFDVDCNEITQSLTASEADVINEKLHQIYRRRLELIM